MKHDFFYENCVQHLNQTFIRNRHWIFPPNYFPSHYLQRITHDLLYDDRNCSILILKLCQIHRSSPKIKFNIGIKTLSNIWKDSLGTSFTVWDLKIGMLDECGIVLHCMWLSYYIVQLNTGVFPVLAHYKWWYYEVFLYLFLDALIIEL